jgi:hypothetical protein
MWQVICKVDNGQVGKLLTRSWMRAAFQYAVWRLRGRATTLGRYV